MYVRGGYNVYPVEVESVLSTHPAVAAVAVVPRPDPVMGEVGMAVVVARTGAVAPALDELRAYAAPHVAAYKLPEAVEIVDALPLTAMEKVDRPALARLIAARSEDGGREAAARSGAREASGPKGAGRVSRPARRAEQ